MTRRRVFVRVLVLAACLLGPAQAQAQVNLLGSTGLGRRVLALDARARGMGGAGVALHGGNLSAINPATAARFATAGVWATYMPERRDVKGEFANGTVTTEDVPVIRLVWPWGGRWAVAVSAGAYLDQDWGVQFIDTLNLSDQDVAFEETRTADGGVSQVRLDFAGIATEGLSLGASFLFYTGQSRRKTRRVFEDDVNFQSYANNTAVDYRGWGLAVGAEWEPIPEVLVGGTFSWGADMRVADDTTGEGFDIPLPLAFNLGSSWQLTPELLLAVALGWEGWSRVADELPNASAVDTWGFGGGVEYALSVGENNRWLVRGGLHADKMPFEVRGGAVWERGFSLGAGVVLARGRARLDFTSEFGGRGNISVNDVEESYRRFSFGAAVFTR